MQSGRATAAFDPAAPTLTEGAQAWSTLCVAMAQRAELDARIVELTGLVQRSGTIELLEGVSLDTALNLIHRLPGGDRGMQLTAADVLADMPATMKLFRAGELSWGQVRGIVAHARRLPRDGRAALDAHIEASRDLLGKLDPDELIDQVALVAAELRDVRAAERAEERVERRNFIWAQPGMLGPGKLYGELDNASLATVMTAADAAAPLDDVRSVTQRRADGLVALAGHRCDGDPEADGADGTPPGTRHWRLDRALPAFTVLVDTRDVTMSAAGTVELNAPGCLPTLTAAACEALARDASVRVVLMDGGRPLTVTKKVWAVDIPDDVRLAVKARDRGDRFPGSRRPVGHIHHLDRRGRGHHVDQLVGLSAGSHRVVHRNEWKVAVDPATGEITFTRGNRTWTTVPRGTRLRRPPPSTDGHR